MRTVNLVRHLTFWRHRTSSSGWNHVPLHDIKPAHTAFCLSHVMFNVAKFCHEIAHTMRPTQLFSVTCIEHLFPCFIVYRTVCDVFFQTVSFEIDRTKSKFPCYIKMVHCLGVIKISKTFNGLCISHFESTNQRNASLRYVTLNTNHHAKSTETKSKLAHSIDWLIEHHWLAGKIRR